MKPTSKKRSLTAIFNRCVARAGREGNHRRWFLPYLEAVMDGFAKKQLRRASAGKRPLKKRVSVQKHVTAVLKVSCKRDRRTRSRWAAAVTNAILEGCQPADIEKWLRRNGGISGAAARKRQKAQQPSSI